MHIIKPDNLSLFLRTLPREGGFALAISAYACFPLAEEGPKELLFEQDMWKKLPKALGENDIFDPGFPKPRAEFLLYGRCFPKKNITGMEVTVRVGEKEKMLQIMGERHWEGQRCSAPKPLQPVRLDWTQAYGGPDFDKNPLGKGYTKAQKPKFLPAPGLLRPNDLLAAPDKPHAPVSFTAIPSFWPQRSELLSAFDDNWLYEDWPYLPRSSKAEFYCTAQPDQRMNGFFQGVEEIEIIGAHPERQHIRSAFPGLRARLFALTRQSDQEHFSEIPNLIDTLWLLPEHEIGIACYRGVLQDVDEDAADVAHVLAAWEQLGTPPGEENLYRRMLDESLLPSAAPEIFSAPFPKPEPEAAPAPAAQEPKPQPAEPPAEILNLVGEAQAAAQSLLAKRGLTAADVEAQLAQHEPPAAQIASPQDLKKMVAEVQEQVRSLLASKGMTVADAERFLAERKLQEPSAAQLTEELDKVLISDTLSPEKRKALTELKQAIEKVEQLAPKSAPEPTPAPDPAPASEAEAGPHLDAEDTTEAEDVQTPSAADYSGQDLQEADFRNAVLEKANFSNAILQGADFSGAILTDADFSNANLSDAKFNSANASGADFSKARFVGTDLRHGQFPQCDFTDSLFYRAFMDFADCSNSKFLNSRILYCRAVRTGFQQTDMSDVDFTGTLMKRTPFEGAVLHRTSFRECVADGAEFYAVQGSETAFIRTSLVNARADAKTAFTHAIFHHVNLTKARWSGAGLKDAHFWNVLMDGCDFSKSQLVNISATRLRGKGGAFSKARFENARLRRINLFRGSFRKAAIINTRVIQGNMFGADLYGVRIVDVRAHAVNVERSLWEKANKNA